MEKMEKIRKSENRKSRAKAAGLKSTFVVADKLALTSFGKGNKANLEKIIKNEEVEEINKPPKFDAKVEEKQIHIIGKTIKDGITEKPAGMRNDLIGAKQELEKMFFGKTFDDNIHIQLIYNILDIKKIFSVYANNIVYAVDHLDRTAKDKDVDYLGTLFTGNTYQHLLSVNPGDSKYKLKKDALKRFNTYYESAKSHFIYFGDVFYRKPTYEEASAMKEKGQGKKAQKPLVKTKAEVHQILRFLGTIRQCLVHKTDAERDIIFNPDSMSNEFKTLIDSYYNGRVKALNDDFIKHNGSSSLPILFHYYGATEENRRAELTEGFYDFIIKRENKNMGFSLKKIREKMLEKQEASFIKEDGYNSVRHKLYILMDFIIYKTYAADIELQESIVATLRSNLTDEDKEATYEIQAKALWNKIGDDIVKKLMPLIDGNKIKGYKDEKIEIKKEWLKDVMISTENASYMTKMVYFMTLFLDGKEINEFLTVLINKFENIQGFFDVLGHNALAEKIEEPKEISKRPLKGFAELAAFTQKSTDVGLTEHLRLFENSVNISDEIRVTKNFARMERTIPDINRAQYADAAKVLGVIGAGEQDIDEYIEDKILGNPKRRTEGDKNLRNFLANNVVESSRFRHIVRYGDVTKVREIMQHKEVIRFVLKKIYENVPTQIDRYIFSLEKDKTFDTPEKKIDFLTEQINQISFEKFFGVQQKTKANSAENVDKEKKKALIGLYLTIAYLLTKNLVNINARYLMAVYNLEKDFSLLGFGDLQKMNKDKSNLPDYAMITKDFLNKDMLKPKNAKYMHTNLEDYSNFLFNKYRNSIAHLAVLEEASKYISEKGKITSYFELYHYIMQRSLQKEYELAKEHRYDMDDMYQNEEIPRKFNMAKKYHTYCKDLVKILNVPFGYNLGRFKAISIEPLFDRNHMGESLKADLTQSGSNKEKRNDE